MCVCVCVYTKIIFSGCFNIHGAHVTVNNSTTNNVFIFVSDLKIVYYIHYLSLIIMPFTQKEKIFCISYLETKSFITMPANFFMKFDNYSQKAKFIVGSTNFKPQVSVNNLNKKTKNPRSCRKLTARRPNNLDVVRDSVGMNVMKYLRRRFMEVPVV